MSCNICDEQIYSRGLCKKHYWKCRYNGTLEIVASKPRIKYKHILDKSSIDEDKKIANCKSCGLTKIGLSKRDGWRCRNSTSGESSLRVRALKQLGEFNGVCFICKIKTNKFVVDHDHVTGKIRNYLCHHCNVGLGFFKDNPRLLIEAAEYIKLHKNTNTPE